MTVTITPTTTTDEGPMTITDLVRPVLIHAVRETMEEFSEFDPASFARSVKGYLNDAGLDPHCVGNQVFFVISHSGRLQEFRTSGTQDGQLESFRANPGWLGYDEIFRIILESCQSNEAWQESLRTSKPLLFWHFTGSVAVSDPAFPRLITFSKSLQAQLRMVKKAVEIADNENAQTGLLRVISVDGFAELGHTEYAMRVAEDDDIFLIMTFERSGEESGMRLVLPDDDHHHVLTEADVYITAKGVTEIKLDSSDVEVGLRFKSDGPLIQTLSGLLPAYPDEGAVHLDFYVEDEAEAEDAATG